MNRKTCLFALLTVVGMNAHAQTLNDLNSGEIDGACFGHYDSATKNYYNSATIPHVFVSSNRLAHIIVQNTSDATLKLYYQPSFYSEASAGAAVSISNETYQGAFSSNNSPKSSSGATLSANSAGRIVVPYQNGNHTGHIKLYWATTECMTSPPVIASAESQYYVSSPQLSGISYIEVNNGNAW